MIKKLKINLVSGTLSEFDSDTTLGIFCWRLLETLGKDKLKDFINYYKNSNPIFTISNALFEVNNNLFFPKPLYIGFNSGKKLNKNEKITEMLKNKETKSGNYITLKKLNAFINGEFEELLKKDPPIYNSEQKKYFVSPGFESQLRVGTSIDRRTLKSSDGKLYSMRPKYLKESNNLFFLIRIFDINAFKEFKCEEILYEVFNIGYGKKKSSGYGQCEILNKLTDFNEINEPSNANGFLVMGNYLPSANDNLVEGIYDTNVKYGRLGEELAISKIPFKRPMLLIKPGSYFKTNNPKPWYGRVTNEGEISSTIPFAVQFGMPFVLNINFNEAD